MIRKINLLIIVFLALTNIILLTGCSTKNVQVEQDTRETYTLNEISKHNSKDDCWLLIEGKVYDVNDFITSHPGGEAILEECGTDATVLFQTRPMGSGTPHSANANNLLSDYYIGDLIK